MTNKIVDPTRLYSSLLNTGLQNKDPALYQVIYQLIGQLAKLTVSIDSGSSGSGGGGSLITVTNHINQILGLDGLDGDEGLDGLPGQQGIQGLAGPMIPYFISSSEIFIVPEFKQALFTMNIDNEGILVVDGFLIEVD